MSKLSGMFRTPDGINRWFTFTLVTSLFLLWGLFSGMIDVLNKHFQDSLHVTKAQSAFVQFSWYGAYFLLALPAGWVARKLGYRGGILTGLLLALAGSLMFVPAVRVHASEGLIFLSFLTALFVVGAGMTFLETVANPYTTVLGPIDAAVARINLAQSCNAIGWMLGPIVISYFILSKTAKADTSNATLYVPYLILAGLVALLIVAFIVSPVPDIHAPQEEQPATKPTQHSRPLLKEKHFVLAVVAQFFYVAGQTGIFSFFINYVKDPDYSPALPTWMANHLPKTMKFLHAGQWHITEYGAGIGLSVAFGCFLAGRFSGSAILRFAKAHITLGVYGLINTLMMALVCLNLGWISIIALMLSYFFMSIMYPTIFALGIRGLGEKTKLAASWIVMSIVGGAVMPMLMGWMADKWSMRVGFLMPLGCFVVIMLYGFMWQGFFRNDMEPEESATGPIIPSH